MSTQTATTPNPDVNVAGMKPGDASVAVTPTQGGGLTLSPLPVGGRRGRKSKKTAKKTAGRRRRGGADDEVAPVEGARRHKTRKGKKAGRR